MQENMIIFCCLQGPFALCRVIKRNDVSLKTKDVQGVKQVGCSTSTTSGAFTSVNEPIVVSDETPTQSAYMSNDSNYSTPITSPYQTTQFGDYESANLWMSSAMILDSSKVSTFSISLVILHSILFQSCCYYETDTIFVDEYRNVLRDDRMHLVTVTSPA